MTNFSIIDIIVSVLTAIGGWEAIRFLINRKTEKRKSEAEAGTAESAATKEVQDVYQQLISDVKSDREEQRAYINELTESRKHLREECEDLRQRIDDTEKLVRELQQQVAENARKVDSLRPFLCRILNCPRRESMDIPEDRPRRTAKPKKPPEAKKDEREGNKMNSSKQNENSLTRHVEQ